MKRFKKSKFDPYINEISEYLAAGMTVKAIAEQLDEYFDDAVSLDAVYAFIKVRGLSGLKYQGGKNQTYVAPRCDYCENCREVIGFKGEPVRMCFSTQLIPGSVKTSPNWCYKRERQAG